jgi:hypothetical protein
MVVATADLAILPDKATWYLSDLPAGGLLSGERPDLVEYLALPGGTGGVCGTR